MKKIYLILASTLLGSAIFSQVRFEPKTTTSTVGTPEQFTPRASANNGVSRTTIQNHVVDFSEAHASYYSSTPTGFWRTLFPDSITPIQYTNSVGYAYILNAAQVFDLRSEVVNSEIGGLQDGFSTDPSFPITLDSVFLQGYYQKGSLGYTDTLVVSVIDYIGVFVAHAGNTAAPVATQWGADTVRSFAIEIDTNTFEIQNISAEYKIPLDLADTSANGLMFSRILAGATVDPRFAINVAFKPGGPYTIADTSNKQLGFYRLYTTEPNGTGTQMSYIKNDLSGAAFYTKFDRYNSPTDRYFSNVHYYSATQSDCFEIYGMFSQTNNRSISEGENGAKLFQNYPNPSNGMTMVKYSLENQANVSFELMDVTGKKVISLNEGNRSAGTHSIEINTAELNAGIYFYSVVVNGNMITKKMTITK